MKLLLSPSLMCADFGHLDDELRALEEAGADVFHVDVMDGHYVDNYGMGMQDIGYVCKNAKIPVEAHLMVINPEKHIKKFAETGIDTLYFHPMASYHPAHTVQEIQKMGMRAGIVLDPETSVETVSQLMIISDYAMIMTVNPGFSGNTYQKYVEQKIRMLCLRREEFGIEIAIDGGVTRDAVKEFLPLGVNRFVLGSTGLFRTGKPYNEVFSELHAIGEKENSVEEVDK